MTTTSAKKRTQVQSSAIKIPPSRWKGRNQVQSSAIKTPPSRWKGRNQVQSSAIKCNQDTSVSMEGTPERRSNPTSDAAAFVSPILLWFSWLC